ncbi:protein LSM14 homolog B-A isoform X1 [Bombus vosnesenskii]|uniref:Protein LSM14 homolog B-A isoform X1 n=3 Tax=Pyrobombus TaxID=144703 RepID=A0A6J3KA91_9HYME|nr:protein LSM14 homolog B-A isoform X1 [Bombus impatiens]XP_033194270.1 protein LSM14 homolog B-A isoform X1 [Bombus vancouverensis nearcticus]XP_033302894.1 protein LSM14 homolog B-A isoform X1 [Bombus bifarius]XP_033350033.1 protein LSM14 homolog B-A isoform X1 [Bombus vosnesenskii]XP_050476675.1 protein LSM14 homolog B-A isoform X1 [Bombus huntii]
MSGGMPELGSKISLISKADIRYEGRLFTVDPQECTIALANVRSFGTEDRETQLPVAPQNQVYEYILFRGSDIKDIRVVNNVSSIPNDPAIVQMTVQPSMSQQSYQPQPSYAHPMMGPMGGQYGTPYGMTMGTMGPVMGMPTSARDPRGPINKQPSELSLGSAEPNAISIPNSLPTANVDPLPKDQSLEDGVLDLISGGSRSTTPTSSLLTRKSPTMDQGIQVGHQQQQQQQQQQSGNVGKLGEKTNMRSIQPARRDHDSHSGNKTGGTVSQYNEGKRDTMKQDGQLQGQGSHNQGGRGNRGGWMNRGNMRGRGRGRGGFRNQPGNAGAKPKNTLKFDNDYDFEQANTEFEELRSQLAKTKIDAGADNEKKDDSGNETGAGEGEPEEEPEIVHYDKSKSFFDNISCEAVERSKGRFQRTDWRTERKLNSETFGVASTRRGGFRGRGYYNRGMGGMYRGGGGAGGSGFRGGYRGSRGGNRKPANQQQQNNPGSQNRTTNEQSTTQSQQNSRVVSF